MELHNISISGKFSGRGFTLIEILLVITLVALIFAFSSALGFDSFRRNYLKTEQDTLVSILQKARSQAINNINNKKHGFYFNGTDYVIFEGDSFVSPQPQDLVIQKNPSITITPGSLTEVVFDQLTGNANPVGDIVLSDGISSITISINQEGRINW